MHLPRNPRLRIPSMVMRGSTPVPIRARENPERLTSLHPRPWRREADYIPFIQRPAYVFRPTFGP